jgi:ribosome-binding protein aMBF1 (putative translation factor)
VKIKQLAELLPFEAENVSLALGETISLARRARFWSQGDLAAKMGVSVNTVVNLEKGRPSVSLAQVLKALWTLDRLHVLDASIKAELDPMVQAEAMRRMQRKTSGSHHG